MPFLFPSGGGGPTTIIEATVEDLGGLTEDTYVNSDTGDDSTGDGTSGAPFLTIPKALSVLKPLWTNGRQRVLLAGVADHIVPDDYVLPSFVSPEASENEIGSLVGFHSGGGLIFESTPVLLATFGPSDYTILSFGNGVADLDITAGGLTPDEFKGCWLVDQSFPDASVITKNTASVITHVFSSLAFGEIRIYRPGAKIRTAAPNAFSPVISIVNNKCSIVFNGIEIEGDAPSFQPALGLSDCSVWTQACRVIGGAFANIVGDIPQGRAFWHAAASWITGIAWASQALFKLFYNFFEDVDFPVGTNDVNLYVTGAAKGYSNLGTNFFLNGGPQSLIVAGFFEDSLDDGIHFNGPGIAEIYDLFVLNPAADGIVIDGGRAIIGSSFYGAAGFGIPGAGVVAKNGAHVELWPAVSIAGASALKIGTQTVSYATFRTGAAPYNRIDAVAALADLSRIYQLT